MTPLSVLGLTYDCLSISLFFSFRSDCIELDFKEISYLVLTLDSNKQLPRFDMPQKITEDGFSSDGASSDCPSDDGQGMDFIDNVCM